jgi:hypothetical protein
MGTATDLSNGIATMISNAGIAVYNTSSVYADSATGIVFKDMPAKPDRCVVITVVPLTDQISMPLGQVMVQVRTRGNPGAPLDVDDLGDSIFAVLHGTTALTFNSVYVNQMNRHLSVPMGMDSLKRWERADQYYLDLSYPPTSNRPAGGSW